MWLHQKFLCKYRGHRRVERITYDNVKTISGKKICKDRYFCLDCRQHVKMVFIAKIKEPIWVEDKNELNGQRAQH